MFSMWFEGCFDESIGGGVCVNEGLGWKGLGSHAGLNQESEKDICMYHNMYVSEFYRLYDVERREFTEKFRLH